MIWLLALCWGCNSETPSLTPEGDKPPVQTAPSQNGISTTYQLTGPRAESPRSIVVISLDTVRADRMGVYGGPAKVAQIESIATNGVVFNQAISHFPQTCLSHWSMLSGVLPGVHGNVPGNRQSVYQGPTLAELAQQQGLATGAFIGGTTLEDSVCGISRGFEHFADDYDYASSGDTWPAEQVTQAAVDWISKQEGPYFAFVHYFDAHFPYTPPAPWDTAYDPDYAGSLTGSDADLIPFRDEGEVPTDRDLAHIRALYDGEISALDADLAPLLNVLGPDVVVAITSDHGESFEHGYYFNHQARLWDSILHVPLIIRAPGLLAGHRVDEQVGLMDLTPTLLELAGLQWDDRMQGESLKGLAMGEDGSDWRSRVYASTDQWIRGKDWHALAIRTENLKVILPAQEHSSPDVFNPQEDPNEERPLGAVPKELRSAETEYAAMIDAMKPFQADPPQTGPGPVDKDCEQLKALGYIDGDCMGPAGPPPPGGGKPGHPGGPQGPAPGQPGGPPAR